MPRWLLLGILVLVQAACLQAVGTGVVDGGRDARTSAGGDTAGLDAAVSADLADAAVDAGRDGAWEGRPDATSDAAWYAGCGGDAGGCYAIPEYDDCLCRCPGGAVGTAGIESANAGRQTCLQACGCGLVNADAGASGTLNYTYGCSVDEDCALVNADCCGCQAAGLSVAILKAHEQAWFGAFEELCRAWRVKFPCFEGYECGNARAGCIRGRCAVLEALDAGSDAGCGNPQLMARYAECNAQYDQPGCADAGGSWLGGGPLGEEEYCSCQTGQEGCPCTRSGDCLGQCDFDWTPACAGATEGTCWGSNRRFGCYCWLGQDGEPSGVCAD